MKIVGDSPKERDAYIFVFKTASLSTQRFESCELCLVARHQSWRLICYCQLIAKMNLFIDFKSRVATDFSTEVLYVCE